MERVTFLIEETNERISCMLNPETVVMRRSSGVKQREALLGSIHTDRKSDNPVMFTGSGMTTLELDLVFDVSIPGSTVMTQDVRELTKPIWNLSENLQRRDRSYRPALCRFIWGKCWNIPGVISALAEKLEFFSSEGIPRRSWLRLRMIRLQQHIEPVTSTELFQSTLPNQISETPVPENETSNASATIGLFKSTPGVPETSPRIDLAADRTSGDPANWRQIADQFNLQNPLEWLENYMAESTDQNIDGDSSE